MVLELLSKPEYYDLLGIIAFTIIILVALIALRTAKRLAKWIIYILLTIGIIGLLIDSAIVYAKFIK